MSGQQEQINNNEGVNENTRPQSPPRGQVNTVARIIRKPYATRAPGRSHGDRRNLGQNQGVNKNLAQSY